MYIQPIHALCVSYHVHISPTTRRDAFIIIEGSLSELPAAMYTVTLYCLPCFVNIAILNVVMLLVIAEVSLIDASPFHDFFVVPTSVCGILYLT